MHSCTAYTVSNTRSGLAYSASAAEPILKRELNQSLECEPKILIFPHTARMWSTVKFLSLASLLFIAVTNVALCQEQKGESNGPSPSEHILCVYNSCIISLCSSH